MTVAPEDIGPFLVIHALGRIRLPMAFSEREGILLHAEPKDKYTLYAFRQLAQQAIDATIKRWGKEPAKIVDYLIVDAEAYEHELQKAVRMSRLIKKRKQK